MRVGRSKEWIRDRQVGTTERERERPRQKHRSGQADKQKECKAPFTHVETQPKLTRDREG